MPSAWRAFFFSLDLPGRAVYSDYGWAASKPSANVAVHLFI